MLFCRKRINPSLWKSFKLKICCNLHDCGQICKFWLHCVMLAIAIPIQIGADWSLQISENCPSHQSSHRTRPSQESLWAGKREYRIELNIFCQNCGFGDPSGNCSGDPVDWQEEHIDINHFMNKMLHFSLWFSAGKKIKVHWPSSKYKGITQIMETLILNYLLLDETWFLDWIIVLNIKFETLSSYIKWSKSLTK